ncbi:hypothetical protein [Clostridium estertheticum]|uniref:Uncharacterized protein n=1 Tax=Clostridium estertheticum TaxID=238834 RepID=A0A7Y3SZJ0_9CLOT|nr:hypothetical protein [Clostridium estertheticum]MBW9172717.1 hypothetical protein [Clostridium estertheticum]NNU78264.1 hypothetical protein [Clostridium estertheticum]WBL49551.1 hypothetical protein LOR37_22165 [Clostridium estertheticum]WLC77748.1 hypothetical protein KTC99_22610 [Clostridium estertheticum]
MIIDKKTTEMYLDKPSKAILDAKNSIFTQSDLQSAIDIELKEIKPKKTFLLQSSYIIDSAHVITAQYRLDEVIKPFVRKINEELNWNINVPDDIMK